jgi:hypothetical protein
LQIRKSEYCKNKQNPEKNIRGLDSEIITRPFTMTSRINRNAVKCKNPKGGAVVGWESSLCLVFLLNGTKTNDDGWVNLENDLCDSEDKR